MPQGDGSAPGSFGKSGMVGGNAGLRGVVTAGSVRRTRSSGGHTDIVELTTVTEQPRFATADDTEPPLAANTATPESANAYHSSAAATATPVAMAISARMHRCHQRCCCHPACGNRCSHGRANRSRACPSRNQGSHHREQHCCCQNQFAHVMVLNHEYLPDSYVRCQAWSHTPRTRKLYPQGRSGPNTTLICRSVPLDSVACSALTFWKVD